VSLGVKDDRIGALFADLKRDGNIHSLKATYDIGLTQTSLFSPGVMLEKGDFDGDPRTLSVLIVRDHLAINTITAPPGNSA
jgi:uncharacterized protein DUF2860